MRWRLGGDLKASSFAEGHSGLPWMAFHGDSERAVTPHAASVSYGHGAVSQHHEARMSAPGSSGTSQWSAFGLSAGRLQCVERTERLSCLATCSGGRLAGAGGTCLRAGNLPADGGGHTNSRIPAGRRRRCNRRHR